MSYRRVDFGSRNVKPELRTKWQDKIVSYEFGEGWSLEGPKDEGVAISAPDDCFKYLNEDEETIAAWLEATFWHRNEYTEDLEKLKTYPRD